MTYTLDTEALRRRIREVGNGARLTKEQIEMIGMEFNLARERVRQHEAGMIEGRA